MAVSLQITEVRLRSGDALKFEPNSLVILVGPNNAGKSTLLREIMFCLRTNRPGRIVESVQTKRFGSVPEFMSWLDQNAYLTYEQEDARFHHLGHQVTAAMVNANWTTTSASLGVLADLLCMFSGPTERAQTISRQGVHDWLKKGPDNPLQVFLETEELETKLSRHVKKQFGFELVVDRGWGSQINVFCGQRILPDSAVGEDRASNSYRQKLALLPTLYEQGDGVRSFVAWLLMLYAGNKSVYLADEPEIFLHQDTANQLGRLIGSELEDTQQMVVATHSADILRGVVETISTRVQIVRITREGPVNRLRVIAADQVAQLFKDPLLMFSNCMEGVFHEKVVVCEADADCRFYAAVLDALYKERGDVRKPDLHFTWSGGKDRTPQIARALYALGVQVCVVTDIDIFNARDPLHSLVSALGGDADGVELLRRTVDSQIRATNPTLSWGEAKDRIVVEANKHEPSATMSDRELEALRDRLKAESPWKFVKRAGVNAIGRGTPYAQIERLLEVVKQSGVHVVPVGEVECLVPQVGGHGPAWVSSVLERYDLGIAPELHAARQFVESLAAWARPGVADDQ